jgi:predicted RNA-binding Zn ribbon-like protein
MASADSAVARSESFRFELSGGRLCLDFANSVGGRGSAREHLRTYGDVLEWSVQAGTLTRHAARQLQNLAAANPEKARRVVRRARTLRDSIDRTFAAVAGGRAPRAMDVARLNAEIARLLAVTRLERAAGTFRMRPRPPARDLAAVLLPIVESTIAVLTAEAERVRVCADPSCAWLFLDSTKNQTRRWCDMKVCGNRSKVRRFRRRAGATRTRATKPHGHGRRRGLPIEWFRSPSREFGPGIAD